ncbi:tetratricopeptide repeat protein [Pelomonas aquatica]|jgi:tetratricopeptide (TPR) repeat protein|uniref:Tetratricopeptide repeat protein n=1 Tax=Pelomonas aquatica TaxID=431058 RepID=A0A9X4R543_9BURK|nr:tetratricopeptide repeat protein [Pelomonas aquatica]MCY4753591.1 tetratricopeptide repeat protein [Pelomonas aquatica]MDG0863265.1 tetratricopeptide repeat protein [Pelomonas aquatica]
MPTPFRRAACAAALLVALQAQAQTPDAATAAPASPPANSAMDAPLFYQLLIGELELNSGQAGTAFQVLLDAARRTGDEELFKRVVNIALQAHAGDQALMAARAWAEAKPGSVDAHQTVVQLLALLNKPAEVPQPLTALLRVAPDVQRAGLIAALPRLFQRSPEPKSVLAALAPVLQAQAGPLKPAALFAEARLSLQAGENARALALTRDLAAALPDGDDAMQLAVDLLPTEPQAEALVTARLQQKPDQHALRQAYARALVQAQRPVDAAREFRLLTEQTPDNPAPWLALGALELDLKHIDAAEAALHESLRRLDTPAAGSDAEIQARADGRRSAWLLLSQAAEQRGDLKAAEAALHKVDGAGLDVKFRHASLLARQGKLAEGRKLLQPAADAGDKDARASLLAEAQLLREQPDYAAALAVLKAATARFPGDTDLIYEQAMMAEKLGRFDEMEALLRHVIELKPDYHHAYNALGYSLADRNVRLAEAKELIERALKLAPGEPVIVDSLGWVEFRLGNLPAAAKLLRQAHSGRPDAEIAAHLGEVLWASGAQDEARRVWQEAAKRDPRNEALRETLGRLKVKL